MNCNYKEGDVCMRNKKLMCLLMATVMMGTLVFSGCSKEEENNNNEFEGEYENDDLNAVYEEDTQNPISYISQQKSTMEFLPDKDINNESNNSGKTQKVLKKKKTNGYKPAKRKITVVKERKNKKSILSKLRKITSKK